MHAYDEIDGVPCIASRELFTDILRDAWGFDGVAVTDYSGIEELVRSHRLVDDLAAAAALVLEAGIDAELPSTAAYGEPLRRALEAGLVGPEAVDRAVARVLRTKVGLGLFERPYVDAAAASSDDAEDRALALELARRSLVLLRNDGILPLPKDLRTVAVIGPNADSARNLLGDYAHVVHIESLLEMRDGPNPFGFPIPTDLGDVEDLGGRSTILTAIASRVSDSTEVRFAPGCGILGGDDAGIVEAVEVARGADAAILVVGERSGLTHDCTCGESRDRLELSLSGRQEELVGAVAATGTPVVLVVVSGRPLALGSAAERSSAVLFAWVPGEEGPEAVADAVFGDVNPGGKLPVTMPRHVGQVPIHYAHKPTGGRSHWKQEYVDGSHRPLWPFGHGLSYSSFGLRDLELDRPDLPTDGELGVAVELENTGDREGDEVVQLYVRDEGASVTRPVKELRGFARVRLAAGERRRVVFRLAAEQLAFTDLGGDLVVEPGWIELMVGTSSEDLPCRARVELVGERRRVERRTRYLTAVEVGPPA
jgi:beta-glucosidase